ncbi:anthranilate phosphoribosyltransferase [Sutcliffiella sp. NC1]|uniref:anthranilate phosphoribosyltransferase n=1 Tax=Sutcliffiella sp. NC1 TaxID=3004096 RepID=UPI0022DD2635|nr:anthranilate phosphoribosyltransferase [Sutcliffiella sp. NC1]WBL13478.1 anthranilate phosphoribosyltransferase [Sutcliffiella sp. NC1]
MFQQYLQRVIDNKSLTEKEAEHAMSLIMDGNITASQIASFITVLRFRGETVEEMLGFTQAMRMKMKKIEFNHPNVIDTCGTGGDSASTFNISTAAAIVASSGGAKVAKHGNRAFTSKSGSADVLEQLQIPVQQTTEDVKAALQKKGMAFLFAPNYHEGMKHAVQPRKEIGFRTIFNILGPLANPVQCKNQVIGVFSKTYAEKMAQVLVKLKATHVLLVCGEDGLDEFSITGKSHVLEVKNGQLHKFSVEPEEVGLRRHSLQDIQVRNSLESAQTIQQAFQLKSTEAVIDTIAYNAGAALYVANIAKSMIEGIYQAKQLLKNGDALRQLQLLKQERGQFHASANH